LHIIKVGRTATLSSFDVVSATNGGGADVIENNVVLPAEYRPAQLHSNKVISVTDNAVNQTGLLYIDQTGLIRIYADLAAGNFQKTGAAGGFAAWDISYITQI